MRRRMARGWPTSRPLRPGLLCRWRGPKHGIPRAFGRPRPSGESAAQVSLLFSLHLRDWRPRDGVPWHMTDRPEGEGSLGESEAIWERFYAREAHVSHAHANLTPPSRLRLTRLIVEAGCPVSAAGTLLMVSPVTARHEATRFRVEGSVGTADRSGRSRSMPIGTPESAGRAILQKGWRRRSRGLHWRGGHHLSCRPSWAGLLGRRPRGARRTGPIRQRQLRPLGYPAATNGRRFAHTSASPTNGSAPTGHRPTRESCQREHRATTPHSDRREGLRPPPQATGRMHNRPRLVDARQQSPPHSLRDQG